MLLKRLPELNLGGQGWLGLRLGMVSLLLAGLALALFGLPDTAQADRFASTAFENYWARADLPVVTRTVKRGYVWGSEPFYTTYEEYLESPNQRRLVQYFDKTRMELTRPVPDGNPSSPFFVTNGLLAKELILGTTQLGDNHFLSRVPAFDIPIAGDPVEINADAPTYASFFNLSAAMLPSGFAGLPAPLPCTGNPGTACASNIRTNEPVVDVIYKDGSLGRSVGLGTIPGARYVYYDRTLKHNIPQVFYDYLTQTGIIFDGHGYTTGPVFDWISTFGYPITDAYWLTTRVGGTLRDVMVQVFERRVLTFTPTNSSGFQVEMGNVGRHYYQWRYNPKYDLSIPICAFCTITPQAAYPGATFVIITEPIFLYRPDMSTVEDVRVEILRPDGKILDAGPIMSFVAQTDPGRVRLAYTSRTTDMRGLYTVIITGLLSTQQAKAFFYIIDIPGVNTNFGT
ncbi:MAG: hypothetical protein HXX20_19235 [Chloroflexi bacterium]|nr:hypothetical protein [Chloroflexota bacterium]